MRVARVGINSHLSSISAFSIDLKRIKLHTDYYGISEQIATLRSAWSGSRFKFDCNVEPLPVIWKSLLEAIPEDNQRF